MNDINYFYEDYCAHIKQIIVFLEQNFGKVDYIRQKNDGIILKHNYNIKNSIISGYAFHGFGCGFQFKNYEIDIEFDVGRIGFTAWSLYSFIIERNKDINENDVKKFLSKKVVESELKCNNNIYFII